MALRKRPVDKVRASRDGHEFHETWVARKAMQLLCPDSDLTAIAVEGLSPVDQASATAEAVEIADITLYYCGAASLEYAARVTIAQCKYSIAEQDTEFRSSHAKKTISKFAATYQDAVKRYGVEVVSEKLDFSLITNRPIFPEFLQAIHALSKNNQCCGEAKKQADQFTKAANLSGTELTEFAAKFTVIGLSGSLQQIGHELSAMLVDWSGTSDSLASARLGQLRKMVRDKAGHVGTGRNIIKKTDVLAAFDIGDPEDLLPCPPALPDVGIVVEREQLADVAALLPCLSEPLLIHAAGGVGKTVFMQSLAAAAQRHSDIVFFDCFGGGAYRSPEDARHLPRRGLVHIANTLAFRGRCDPILPGSGDVEALLRTFRQRLAQYVKTLGYPASGRGLILFIDAMDNAEMIAGQQSGRSFPVLVLESLHYSPIDGVKLIVSCRTERKPHTSASFREFELKPFTIAETESYLTARMASVSNAEINVAQARSGGNPRVLEHFIESGSRLFDVSEIGNKVELDDLIQQRISDALRAAVIHGYPAETINAFLAGLAVLPPPVPLDEYADAHGLEKSAVESFASDLHPLLERTSQGLMFRDEPTETLVHNRYSASKGALRNVAARLMERQDVSVYAARALPNLLHLLDDGDRLFALAFDERYPNSITSAVGRRNVRYARLKAATLHAAIRQNHNHLVRLLLELSTVAAIDQRGTEYILDSPDLVVAAKDADASRRLFEARTGWPGARHARLTIAHTLSGDIENAYRHAVIAGEWVEHYLKTDDEEKFREARPEHRDIAAIPFFLIVQGRVEQAAQFFKNWYPWFAYEVCEYIFSYLHQVQPPQTGTSPNIAGFIDAVRGMAPLTAALSFSKFEEDTSKAIIKRIAALCDGEINFGIESLSERNSVYKLQDGLRNASTMALNLGLNDEALKISQATPHDWPDIWAFVDAFYNKRLFSFLFHQALCAAVNGVSVHEKDVLPKELEPLCAEISAVASGAEFRKAAKKAIQGCVKRSGEGSLSEAGGSLSYEDSHRAQQFVDTRLEPVLNLTRALSKVLAASSDQIDQAFLEMLDAWQNALIQGKSHSFRADEMVFRFLGRDMAMFVLWSRSDLGLPSVQRFIKIVHSSSINAHTIIQIVAILARRQALHEVAGAQAVKARAAIEAEDDVTLRASLFARLGRAILPASRDEASAYFHSGLEQMDAIGSGDYEFLNELLLFAATLKGDELEPCDFHALGNICELNMGEEPEKFFWGPYSRAMSRTSGLKGLARISRWDDRSKVGLDCTLMPYLAALVADRKIDAELAVSLNYLADPAEFYFNGTKEFSEAIQESVGNSCPDIVSELIRQYRHNNPGVSSGDTVKALAELSAATFGNTPETFYLSEGHSRFSEVNDTNNYLRNYRGESHAQLHEVAAERKLSERAVFASIVADVNPVDRGSLATAASKFHALNSAYELKDEFFSELRRRVNFGERQIYIKNLLALEGFHFYWVLDELEACKDEWSNSSTALAAIYADAACSLVRLHADDLIGHNRLSGSYLSKISNVTGVHVSKLALELVKVFAQQDDAVPGSVWLALGSFLSPEADEGQGQKALQRLLRSDAPRLADNVVDGKFTAGLYPDGNTEDIAAGIIWRVIGSQKAEDRWRAAHSIRCLARFGRWGVVDAIVAKLGEQTAGCFQAGELPFYFLHARLWLLISLARLAIDYPEAVTRYQNELLSIIAPGAKPHALMQHFAAAALFSCLDSGCLTLAQDSERQLRSINQSLFPPCNQDREKRRDSYGGRPKSASKPAFEFHLDYDFRKHEVDSLARVFGKSCWEVEDLISEFAHSYDPSVSSMYDAGGRETRGRQSSAAMSSYHHTYGQQLGWHALFIAAGKLIATSPVVQPAHEDYDRWRDWLGGHTLTRNDGFWLSDGRDWMPLDIANVLQETTQDGLSLTGNREKLLQLIGIAADIGAELVVEGDWHSADDINVRISSALVPKAKARELAHELAQCDPMQAWLPAYEEHEGDSGENFWGEANDYKPWIVCPRGDSRLDEHDPFGAGCVNRRPRLASAYVSALSLSKDDRFGRGWKNVNGSIALRAEAWGRAARYSEQEGAHAGGRLKCSSEVLAGVLEIASSDLLVLIKLQKYERGFRGESGKFTNTTAVVRIDGTLRFEYFQGHINNLHKSRY